MIKKITSLLICLIIILTTLTFSTTSFAASSSKFEGVYVNKPYVTFYVEGEVDEVTDVKLNDENLNIEEFSKYSIDEESVAVYVIVDVSGSVPSNKALDVFKDELVSFAKTFGDDDSFVLYTMGNKATKQLNGGEEFEKVKSTINGISKTKEYSYIYNTLNTIYDDYALNTNYDRQFVLIISDGVNYSNETSYEKIYNKYATHSLPIYSLLYDTGEIGPDGSLVSQFKDLINDSGGKSVSYTIESGTGKLTDLVEIINNKTIVKCLAKSNTIDENIVSYKISCSCDGTKEELTNIIVSTNNVDDTSPTVEEIAFDKKTGNFKITFSENIIADTEKITITRNSKNIKIGSCSIDENILTIKPKEEIYTGEYTFNLESITDISNEKNKLSSSSVTQKIEATNVALKIVKDFWWILIIIGLLIAILLILLFVKKKKHVKTIREIFETQVEEENVEVKHTQVVKKQYYTHPAMGAKKLSMVVEFNGSRNKVEVDVVSSVIIGRSADCDICVEDTKLSRQHFVIETVGVGFVISDLRTTNGTFVNGTKVTSKQLLHIGDKIVAGTSMFVIL